jgi:hypothetical protein
MSGGKNHTPPPEHVRMALDELGSTFIKLGQLLSGTFWGFGDRRRPIVRVMGAFEAEVLTRGNNHGGAELF